MKRMGNKKRINWGAVVLALAVVVFFAIDVWLLDRALTIWCGGGDGF